MAAAAQHGSVWVGFMDIVPVIGTVKEGVEWAVALYEENKEVVKEKEKAINELLLVPALPLKPQALAEPESLVEPMKGLKLPETPEGGKEDPKGAAGSTSPESVSALQDVKEVKLEVLVEYVCSVPVSKKKTPSHKSRKKEETEKMLKIRQEMLEKIRLIKPDYVLSTELQRETRGSKRGEHVFNNNILKFYSTVVRTEFGPINLFYSNLFEYMSNKTHMGYHRLRPDIEQDICSKMVVTFDETDFYVNANSFIYGVYSKELRSALLKVLLNPHLHTRSDAKRVNHITDLMNDHGIYVDQMAKAKWINNEQIKRERFNKVKGEVADVQKSAWLRTVQENRFVLGIFA